MAIDPKELRIGSHVEFDGKRMIVVCISGAVHGADISLVEPTRKAVYKDIWACELKPIPITPELLTELRFEYRDNTYWERWFKGGFDIERKEDSKYFDYSSELRLEYLHELENLYYMIYGVELTTD